MDIYREVILDHYKNPRNFGHLAKPDTVAQEGNVTCGDRIVMEIAYQKQPGRTLIRDIRFNGEGCAISQASASLLTQKVKGMDIKRIMKLTVKDILVILGVSLTPTRIKCAVLPLEVLHKAIEKVH